MRTKRPETLETDGKWWSAAVKCKPTTFQLKVDNCTIVATDQKVAGSNPAERALRESPGEGLTPAEMGDLLIWPSL